MLQSSVPQEAIEALERAKANNNINKRISTGKFPINPGGANFKTHSLIKETKSRYVHKPTFYSFLVCFVPILISLIVLLVLFFKYNTTIVEAFKNENILSISMVILFFSGIYMFYKYFKPISFDKNRGTFKKGLFKKPEILKDDMRPNILSLKDIIAIQIIGEEINSKNNFYNSFELNIILPNGIRSNIIDHSDLKSIIADAKELSFFLNVPIWHIESNKLLEEKL